MRGIKRLTIGVVGAAALVALAACKNGGNNTADTTGMSAGKPADTTTMGSAGAPGSAGSVTGTALPVDTGAKKKP